ncbi:MAG TPA: hypothetical protein VNC39_15325 [Acidocella sp.]|jgi:hypothetical protein|uniref:hypothetical protein n=1 Tax=Acidocella sp. TaxID=50710 RepID=UPI002C97EC24|nr:hypothetical protein [Acidocella sp.]HVE23341.1 hypothetical protein [Acidocella sp.]
MKRRQILGGLAAALVPSGFAAATQTLVNAPALTLLVGGPEGDQISRWGNAFALAMAGSFPGNPVIRTAPVGGLDGVTGANKLDALVVPDGRTAAILPGAALNAWLVGDSRVHFDPTRWVPLMIGRNSGVLVVRMPTGTVPSLQNLRAMAPLRLAVYQPESNDLAALLALVQMGVPVVPVFGLRDSAAKARMFLAGELDAVFLAGEGVPEDIAPLSAGGGVPVFCLGGITADGTVTGDPLFPGLPDVESFGGGAPGALDGAFRAASMAAGTDFLVVLPRLSDPNKVAQWDQAMRAAIASPGLVAAASASSVTLQPAPVARASLAMLGQLGAGQGALQKYLAKQFGWQPD